MAEIIVKDIDEKKVKISQFYTNSVLAPFFENFLQKIMHCTCKLVMNMNARGIFPQDVNQTISAVGKMIPAEKDHLEILFQWQKLFDVEIGMKSKFSEEKMKERIKEE